MLTILLALALPELTRAEAARDPWLRPFASSSIWNTAIGSAAHYSPAHVRPAATIGLDDELLFRVPADCPVRPVFAPAGWEHRAGGTQRLGSLQLPDDLIVPDAREGWTPNDSAALLMPDGRTVRNVAPMCRPTAGGPVYGFLFNPDIDMRGDGITGSHGGSGMSALGGSIRLSELTGSEPIHHAIKLELFCKRYAYYGPDRQGFRWPAARADAYAAKEYGGTDRELVMGSLLAVPPDVKVEDLNLKTAVGRKLFAALQDYGGYLVDDTAWDCHSVCAEQGVGQEVERAFGLKFDGSGTDLKDDINALFMRLAVVTNNGPDSVGGGGTPRQPAAPPLAEMPPASPSSGTKATAIPSVRNPSMTDGDQTPANWTNIWSRSGKIKVHRDAVTFHSAPASLALDSVDGPAHGQVMQSFDASAGAVFHLSGYIRAAGKATATFGVQSYTADWKGIEFKAMGAAPAGLDWQHAEGDVALPANTSHAGIVLMLDGDGTAWLDDVRLSAASGVSPPPAAKAPPKAPNSVTPAEGFYPDYPTAWRKFVDGEVERARKGDIDIVFLGDSLTLGWAQQPLWKRRYEPVKAVDFGVGGDGTPQVLWRIDHGILDGYHAKVIVLMIGINNTWPGYSADDTAEGIKKVVATIRPKQPEAKVLLLGVLPIFDENDPIRARIRRINDQISKLDDRKAVRFLDMGSRFIEPDGRRIADLYLGDRLHLSPRGYEVWADAMEPLFHELLDR